jgi:endoglucanase
VAVIPNCHTLYSGWSDGEDGAQGLWYNDNWPVQKFTAAWQAVARAFAGDPLVIGYDIKNEPRPAVVGGLRRIPGWGTGGSNADFRLMYSQAADLIHAIDPAALAFCEGLSYAGDLTAAGAHPVTPAVPGRVVYSLHDYQNYHPAGQSRAAYLADMHARGGYLLDSGEAPVWLGEFSAGNQSPSSLGLLPGGAAMNESGGGIWFQDLLAWMRASDCDFAWWQMGGTHARATVPGTNVLTYNRGDRCTGGLFSQSWYGPSSPYLLGILQSLQQPRLGPGT